MSSSNLNGLSLFPQTERIQYESDVEAELEVDQLDSDSDPEEQVDTAKAPKAKNGAGRPGERVPGHTLLPAVRLENIIQADGVTGSMALSKEGLFVLSIATEEFIKRLIQAGHREASAHRRNQINYTDMAATTQQYQEFMCLADTIPVPLTLADALALRQQKERELFEDNPALAFPYPAPSSMPSPEPEPGSLSAPRPSKKSRAMNGNGKEKMNGSGSGSKRSSKKSSRANHHDQDMDVDGGNIDWTVDGLHDANGPPSDSMHNHRRSSQNGMSAAFSSIPPPPVNGHPSVISPSHSPPYSREDSLDPGSIASQPHGPDSHSHTPPYDSAWPGQFTGPASGFLQGPVAPFGRISQNPGRTIYSQTHRPD
ncbi:hypothetical protein GALMADRAFT_220670 [Galerina marginata CBS 339.88]|uniref:Transcription factor CBF/NF-Y/archaeal histone domain-containing protein n=1 Tax=Galerina marginata (strain CBS 339.88) TaxID=685588 RepID=A0A067THH9_GALM3|nr:hypothetical protein GALMADRAFT_220670 [Galerina marginata CBS 339.88]